ncbi:hypothetical protein BKA82DRAFT_1003312 [Pisolithus tinctorius]|uniref:Uncharacterized protein n=1 Tax=Pisolithus tinctorius Marx 270 TaxID=870435 RepID=A0A0C3P0Z6_PISTI|nr:hypothetical protein BKA82DRAFT_1003312 [Pisolithus tinctorius]KIO01024.1 hypothetical protein M404DRAFT_1003312 [Pisolithus tinctorius Marx 270]
MCAINIKADFPDRPSSSRALCIFVGRLALEVSSSYLARCCAVALAFRVVCFPHSALAGDTSFIQFRVVVIEI